ncbi:FKBP-type peptidyl-prolyl cis-trans isomerase [soil metagenome]
MKNRIFPTIVSATLAMVLLNGCDLFGPPKLESDDAKTSYALGLQVGQTVSRQDLPNVEAAFIQGYRDGVAKAEPKLAPDALRTATIRAQDIAMKKQEGKLAAAALSKTEGVEYLKSNKAKPLVKTTASGLQYEVINDGEGPKPKDGDSVEVQYTGTLLNGKKFDSSIDRGAPSKFSLNQMLPGWTEALKLMPVGSKWKLSIPPQLAYGEAGSPPHIPPNSVLIFELELLSITKNPEPSTKRATGK